MCVHHGEVSKDNDSGSRVPGKSKDNAQTCEKQDECADMDLGGPKQESSLKDMAQDSNGDEELVCPNPLDHSQGEVNRCRGVKEENDENFDDLLGLSASGIRELEMSWSQSQTTDEAPTQSSAKTGQRTVHEMVDSERFGCDTAEEDQYNDKELLTDDVGVNDVRIEATSSITDNEANSVAASIPDPDVTPDDITFEQGDSDLLNHTPISQASTNHVECSVTNQGYQAESDELSVERLEAGEVNTSGQKSNIESEKLNCMALDKSQDAIKEVGLVNNPLASEVVKDRDGGCGNDELQRVTRDAQSQGSKVSGDVLKNSGESKGTFINNVSDPQQSRHQNETQSSKDCSQSSVKANETSANPENNPQDSRPQNELWDSKESSQSSKEAKEPCSNPRKDPQDPRSENGTQDTTEASEPSESSPGKGKKRCLSRRGRKAQPRPQEVIEIWEDDLPLSQPKRSARLRGRQKMSYKV